jgi:hypothetical protein
VGPIVSLVSVLEFNASCEEKSLALALARLVLSSDIQVMAPLVGFRVHCTWIFFTHREHLRLTDPILMFLLCSFA